MRAQGWAEAEKAKAQRNLAAMREHGQILGQAPHSKVNSLARIGNSLGDQAGWRAGVACGIATGEVLAGSAGRVAPGIRNADEITSRYHKLGKMR